MSNSSALIVGGGIIGCALALELAQENIRVTVIERSQPGREASWAAAGMLAPTGEHPEHPAMAHLTQASARLYPAWLARLRDLTALDVGHRTEGTLQLAFTEGEAQQLALLPGQPLAPAEVRRLEPGISDRVLAAHFLPQDHHLDNRRLLEALLVAARGAGVELQTQTSVHKFLIASGRARGVLLADGRRLEAGVVVNAAGCWAGGLGAEAARLAPTRPVRGQMVALRAQPELVRHVLRSARAYIVPRRNAAAATGGARLLVGSTMEDAGFDSSVTPEGLRWLLAGAREILPALPGLAFEEAWAGLRPDTPDHLPILGATNIENLYVATGHFRNGILLAPITAKLMTEVILGRPPSLPLEPFSPLRFAARE